MLKVQGLNVAYGQVKAVREVSLQLNRGETVALLGVNGAGKSTVLLALAGILKPESGKILYRCGDNYSGNKGNGIIRPRGKPHGIPAGQFDSTSGQWVDITTMGAQERVRLGIALVPEGRHVFPTATVRENLLVGAHIRGDNEVEADVERMYRLFPALYEKQRIPAMSLSGGQQQMLAIARALMSRPRLLLLDEPTMGLSPKLCEEVYRFIEKSSAEGLTVLVSGEDGRSLRQICSRALTVVNGALRT
ncbi:ABC transporter ATP-binding protein [Acetanaerobacterium elongatum]|uniref:Branched-chain amino acid transport system ATP-binding protein n=1 Tax=Acetanaerobacterium elongatum TaxID=258515 RepID=A0A1G9UN94_9FIRM|nr:ABC transporter ATP-binding protein [Acetanaerobacterium elongatum]SDM61400.1 branched-chain amino acid transport system ATP-binding protein [Acetanaerobacterium elongatum]